MEWGLKNPDAGNLIAAFKFYGQPIPAGLVEPKLNDVERELYSAFWELSTDRYDILRPIPARAIREYECGFSKETFAEIIRRMDNAYLQHQADKQGKK